jgi:Tol biopolymer transport system component
MLGALGGPVLVASKGQETAGAAKRFLDAATEFEVLRVTELEHNAWLPLASNRCLTRRGDALIFASDRSGRAELYRHDFKANRDRQLTEAEGLDTNSFTLTAGDRAVVYCAGGKVLQTGGARDRAVFELPAGYGERPRLAVGDDGLTVVVSSWSGTKTQIWRTGKGAARLEERDGDIGSLLVRPRRPEVSYVAGGEARLLPLDGRKGRTLRTAPGEVMSALWTADGAALLYLLRPAAAGERPEIRELAPEGGQDALVAKTSNYGHFQRNGDATVFLGASASVASPHVLLLLRSVKRELTICEHRSSDARLTRAVLSPNSSRMVFLTDRHGRLVIYAMAVDRLIEETEDKT